ncbi:MAG: YaiI/YqxD family protein [Bacilli bacterium]|nr:YaiI/YqxD family protein [Bacilli bacterium]
MRIIVDADACPVKEIILKVAKKHSLEVKMFFDNSHLYEDGYSEVFILDKGPDSVDYFLINKTLPGDIVVTQDYGVASMALAKKAYAINNHGLIFNKDNILELLSQRAYNQKVRRHKNLKGPKKRQASDNEKFEASLILLIHNK